MMNAICFETKIKDGAIEIPERFRSDISNGDKVTVTVIEESDYLYQMARKNEEK
jgi:hypothetical protein